MMNDKNKKFLELATKVIFFRLIEFVNNVVSTKIKIEEPKKRSKFEQRSIEIRKLVKTKTNLVRMIVLHINLMFRK